MSDDVERRARQAAERVRSRAHELAGQGLAARADGRRIPRRSTARPIGGRVAGAIVVVAAVAGGAWIVSARDDGGGVVTDGGSAPLVTAAAPSTTASPSIASATPAATTAPIDTVGSSSTARPSSPPEELRPFVDPRVCDVTSARESTMESGTLHLFARSREVPIPIQVIGDPIGGPTAPFALVQRYFTSDFGTGLTEPVEIGGITVDLGVYPNGNGEARWDLPDGSEAYLRARGLDRAALELVIGRLTPRDPSAAIPGFDYEPDPAAPSLQLVAEHLNTDVSGRVANIECAVAATGFSYRIGAVDGEAVFEYGGVIDRPAPLDVGLHGGAVIVISGPADPTAPTPADVTTTDEAVWADLLAAPTQLEIAAGDVPTGDVPPPGTGPPPTTWLVRDGSALVGRWTDGRNVFEFFDDGVVRFTLEESCDGSYVVDDGVIAIDFGTCGSAAVTLAAPIFRSAKVYVTPTGDAIFLDGDPGVTRLERVD